MKMTRSISIMYIVALIFCAFTLSACSSAHIRADSLYPDEPNFTVDDDARIPDTTEVRQVLDVVAQYRSALVRKDFGTLNRLISDNYYDNAGTTHTTSDDYGREQLDEVFEKMARYADNVQYKVIVKAVKVEHTRAQVDFEYQYAYQYTIADEVTWDAGVDVNRVQLVMEGDRWRIVSGL